MVICSNYSCGLLTRQSPRHTVINPSYHNQHCYLIAVGPWEIGCAREPGIRVATHYPVAQSVGLPRSLLLMSVNFLDDRTATQYDRLLASLAVLFACMFCG